jgi:hypothetical protein
MNPKIVPGSPGMNGPKTKPSKIYVIGPGKPKVFVTV